MVNNISNNRIKTHKNFQNVYSEIECNDAETIYNYFGWALDNQDNFRRSTPFEERFSWTEKNLKSFRIDLEKIDRIYNMEGENGSYSLTCRMEYENKPLFVYINVYVNSITAIIIKELFVSFDPNLFFDGRHVNDDDANDIIRESIYRDAIEYERCEDKQISKKEEEEDDDIIIIKKKKEQEDFNNPIKINKGTEKIQEYIRKAINHRDRYVKKTSRQEKSLWTEEKLQNWEIDVAKIDSIYSINRPTPDQCFNLTCRMKYKKKLSSSSSESTIPIFVELFALPENECDEGSNNINGLIFVSFDHSLFIDGILLNKNLKYEIWQSLEKDGYFNERGLTRIRLRYNLFTPSILKRKRKNEVTTHALFKSVDSRLDCNDAETIEREIGLVLDYQTEFEKRTTPYEIGKSSSSWWGDDHHQLENFQIDLCKIDRLYYIHIKLYPYSSSRHFELVCRMKNNNDYVKKESSSSSPPPPPPYIYVQMNVWSSKLRYFDYGNGKIFVSKDVNLFMNTISAKDRYPNWKSIHQSLIKDELIVRDPKDIGGGGHFWVFEEAKNDYDAWFWGL